MIKTLNRKIYKGRYAKQQSFINGVVVREKTPAMNTDHHHILMFDDGWLPEFDRMSTLVNRHIVYLWPDRNSDIKKKNYIEDRWLQPYFNDGNSKLEKYLTKQIECLGYSWEKASDSIGLLTANDVAFGGSKFNRYH